MWVKTFMKGCLKSSASWTAPGQLLSDQGDKFPGRLSARRGGPL